MKQQSHPACEQTKLKQKQNHVTSHSNWPPVLLFELASKQCNGIIKGWRHYLMFESKGSFLDNNILMFGSARFLVVAQIQFSLIKKWRLDVQNIFALLPRTPPKKSGHQMCITSNSKFWKMCKCSSYILTLFITGCSNFRGELESNQCWSVALKIRVINYIKNSNWLFI